MAATKTKRDKKRQLGQFMTPINLCQDIVKDFIFTKNTKILEPSFGIGNFIITLIDRFIELYDGDIQSKLDIILTKNIWGVEYDEVLYLECLERIKSTYGYLPENHNLVRSDFFLWSSDIEFDEIIGNPPFGGTLNPEFQSAWEKVWGWRNGEKIKKETYSFFMIKSIEHLKEDGRLTFISSDTFLTIKTMKGLRKFLIGQGFNEIQYIDKFSEETDYPMVVLTNHKSIRKDHINLSGKKILVSQMEKTDNFSWNIQSEWAKYFDGKKLTDYLLASSGMTIGKNEYFVRDINSDGTITEEYDFQFFQDPITLDKELEKAKNGFISVAKQKTILGQQTLNQTKRNIKVVKLSEPKKIQLPSEDYLPYNKAQNDILYSQAKSVVYWKDDGDAVITFKKNGNWYLHGVGGKPFFKKEGITWQLISSSIKARYLPQGYILDSGAPLAILKPGIDKEELIFILGWLLTNKCNEILKKVINHTKNIQSKDIERLPYPFWVSEENKLKAIEFVKISLRHKKDTGLIMGEFQSTIDELYK